MPLKLGHFTILKVPISTVLMEFRYPLYIKIYNEYHNFITDHDYDLPSDWL